MIYRRWAEKSFGKSIMCNGMNVLWAPRGAGKTTLVKKVCGEKFDKDFHYFDMKNKENVNFDNDISSVQKNALIVYDHCDELFSDVNHPFDEKIKSTFATDAVLSIKILFIVDNLFIEDYFSHNMIFGRSKPRYLLPHINRKFFKWNKSDLNLLGRLENNDIEKLSHITGTPAFHLKALTGKYSSIQELEVEAKQIALSWLQEHEIETNHESRPFNVPMTPPIFLF
jgi:hypothetical protein